MTRTETRRGQTGAHPENHSRNGLSDSTPSHRRFEWQRTADIVQVAALLAAEAAKQKRQHRGRYSLQGEADYGGEYCILRAFHAELIAELDTRRDGGAR